MKYKEIVKSIIPYSTKEEMEKLNCMTDAFVEKVREKMPQMAEEFVHSIHDEFFFIDYDTAKMVVDKMQNENHEQPIGEKWDKETTLKVFADAGHPTHSDRYSENGVYFAMNMVYSDFYPMYGEDVKSYIEHAFLFLNDKDFKGDVSKEKWYIKKFA